MRLIDADALKKTMDECIYSDRDRYSTGYAMSFIDDAPTVDAVPVVRCKDCKWFNHIIDRINPGTVIERRYEYWECEFGYSADDEWFCADGERRDA